MLSRPLSLLPNQSIIAHNGYAMKKIMLLIVGLLFLGGIPATVFLVGQRQELRKKAAPATSLSFTPSNVTKQVGDTFTLEAVIDTAENQVVAAEIHVVYDPAILEAQTIANGPLFPNVLASGVVERGTATITVGAANQAQPVKGTGTAATIRFKTLAPTTAAASIRFATNTFVGSLGEGATNVLINTVPANITITGSGQTGGTSLATPSATLAPTLTPTLAASGSSEASASALKILSPAKDSSTTDTTPLIQGKTTPGGRVTLTIYSTPQTVVVTADGSGNWTYTPTTALEPGPHSIVATSQNPATGATMNTTTAFVVAAAGGNGATQSATPIAGTADMTILLLTIGIILFATGILVPVVF